LQSLTKHNKLRCVTGWCFKYNQQQLRTQFWFGTFCSKNVPGNCIKNGESLSNKVQKRSTAMYGICYSILLKNILKIFRILIP
jgi:hypothetical protein